MWLKRLVKKIYYKVAYPCFDHNNFFTACLLISTSNTDFKVVSVCSWKINTNSNLLWNYASLLWCDNSSNLLPPSPLLSSIFHNTNWILVLFLPNQPLDTIPVLNKILLIIRSTPNDRIEYTINIICTKQKQTEISASSFFRISISLYLLFSMEYI